MADVTTWVKRAALSASALTLIGLVACDRQDERLNRIGELSDAVIGQLGGEDVTGGTGQNYASVSVEARAFAGTILERAVAVSEEEAAPRFVIGSIVAKPAALPEMVEMAAVMAQPEMSLDVVVDEQSEAKIIIPDQKTLDQAVQDPDVIRKIELPQSKSRSITVVDPEQTRRSGTINSDRPVLPRAPLKETITSKRIQRGVIREDEAPVMARSLPFTLPPTPDERMAQLPKLNPKVAERAFIQPTAALERQLVAEERMIEVATKFKVAASIQRSRSGQMVIEI